MNINDLIDRAIQTEGIRSQNKLAMRIDTSSSGVSAWRRGWTVPTDKYVISLCNFAKIQPEIGLLWAASWRSEGEAQDRWERMARSAETKFGFTSEAEKAA